MKPQPNAFDAGEFARFLAWLAPNPERAAEAFETLRRKLEIFFSVCGSSAPDLASDTLDRAIKRCAQGGLEDVDPMRYILGIARNVRKEYWRTQKHFEEFRDSESREDKVLELNASLRRRCFRSCFAALPQSDQNLLRDWHIGSVEGERKRIHRDLSAEYGKNPDALRQYVRRLQLKLGECILNCEAARNA